MPRKARIDAPGALHHVIVRGIERGKIFRNRPPPCFGVIIQDATSAEDIFPIPLPEACWFSLVAVSATNEKARHLCALCDLAV